jgi:hypothetical protein
VPSAPLLAGSTVALVGVLDRQPIWWAEVNAHE